MSARLEVVKRRAKFDLGNFLGLRSVCFQDENLIVFAKFNLAAMLPTEDDSLRIHDDEFARNETRILKFQLGNLAFAAHSSKVRAPGDCAGGNEIVTGDFDRLDFVLGLHDSDDFVKMSGVMSDPFACQI